MAFLRRNLKCFYCGKASDQAWHPGLRSFLCKICDATNYLDENGGITDPPSEASSSPSARQYAQLSFGSRSPSPVTYHDPSAPVFCHTCTSNQQFVTQALAEYLPSPQDPRHREYEKLLPNYRRQLESRYPQVCANCEPRVKEQIRAAGYTAKSDYVRRMNDKSKRVQPRAPFLTKRRVVGIWAGLVWLTVLSLQLAWNILGVVSKTKNDLGVLEEPLLSICLRQVASKFIAPKACVVTVSTWVPHLLLVNVLSIWWNPILLRSTRRARGVGEFYRLQTLLLVLRGSAWYVLSSKTLLQGNEDASKAVHSVMIVVSIAITLVSLYTAQPVPHIVRFHKDSESSVLEDAEASGQQEKNIDTAEQPHKSPNKALPVDTVRNQFPIKSLMDSTSKQALNSSRQHITRYTLSTPSPDSDDNFDAMDIDTPETSKRMTDRSPVFYRDSISSGIVMSSLERGSFRPPAPLKQSSTRQLRSRTRQSRDEMQRKSSLASNWDLETIASRTNDEDALTIAGDEDAEDSLGLDQTLASSGGKTKKDYQFKDARFHAKEDDTGLEGMLDFFGLKDDPLESANDKTATIDFHAKPGKPDMIDLSLKTIPGLFTTEKKAEIPTQNILAFPFVLTTAPLFLMTLAATWMMTIMPTWTERIQMAALVWCAAIGASRVGDALRPERKVWELSSILTYIIECGLAIALLYMQLTDFYQTEHLKSALGGHGDSFTNSKTGTLEDRPILDFDVEVDESGRSVDFNSTAVTVGLLVWVAMQEAVLICSV